ncbi:hypothetical protein PoHVEF18_010356 [Penicillium ochrochloron]
MAAIPKSDHTVRVKLLDTTTYLTGVANVFVEPVMAGHETFSFYDFAFLIENVRLGQKVMFDLGTRKDYWNLAPAAQRAFGADSVMTGIKIDKNVADVLTDGGVQLNEIGRSGSRLNSWSLWLTKKSCLKDSCIWSHYHYDHCGNMAPFPPSTSITVGSGFTAAGFLPGYPENPASPVLASDFENRNLVEINFEDGLTVGGFSAHDYFGDGSLYLLDSPGHCPGHISALARTTPSSTDGGATFLFLGGDICHFAGDFRPSPERPLPDPIPESALAQRKAPIPCPCSFTPHHPYATNESEARTIPWYNMASKIPTVYKEFEIARSSVLKMQVLDQDENILVCLAHDAILLDAMPLFNKTPEADINNWKIQGLKEKCHWGWLNDVPIDEKPAKDLLVEGFWRDGKPWDYEAFKQTLTIPPL